MTGYRRMPRAGGGFVDIETTDPGLLADPEYQKCETPIERAMFVQLRAALPTGTDLRAQVWLGPYRVDLLVSGRVVVECDGFAYHSEMDKRARDVERSLLLERIGYRVMHFWGQEIDRSADILALRVAGVVAQGPGPGDLPPVPPGPDAEAAIRNIKAQMDRKAGKREYDRGVIHLPYRPLAP